MPDDKMWPKETYVPHSEYAALRAERDAMAAVVEAAKKFDTATNGPHGREMGTDAESAANSLFAALSALDAAVAREVG